jgi:hypothetical protein
VSSGEAGAEKEKKVGGAECLSVREMMTCLMLRSPAEKRRAAPPALRRPYRSSIDDRSRCFVLSFVEDWDFSLTKVKPRHDMIRFAMALSSSIVTRCLSV